MHTLRYNVHCTAVVSNAYHGRRTTCMAYANSVADGRRTISVTSKSRDIQTIRQEKIRA
ncbi:MAG: hypothetical protein HXL35_03000 [Prevotellaceae bacterium]|nr:hypothetical protein [Prevotellaceae bacterium]